MVRTTFLTIFFVLMASFAFAAELPIGSDIDRLSAQITRTEAFQEEQTRFQLDTHNGLTYRFIGNYEDGALQLFVNGQAENLSQDEDLSFNSQIGVQYKFRF